MKKTLLTLFLITSLHSFGQNLRRDKIVEYNKVTKLGFYESYVSKHGDTIHIGDTLQIGKASNYDKFVHIHQDKYNMHADHTGKKVVVQNIETYGRKKSGYGVYLKFKGFGLLPVYVNYEAALEAGEIKLVGAKLTKDEAIAKLKKQKELLDLQIISQSEYDKLKEELMPIIIE